MTARHRVDVPRRRARRLLSVMAALVVLAGVGLWGFESYLAPDDSQAASCEATPQRIAVTPELQGIVEDAARALATTDADCALLDVVAAGSSTVASGALGDDLPALWIPDSAAWLSRTAPSVPAATAHTASLASSPVVLVSRSEIPQPSSWLAALGSGSVAVSDPLTSSSGAAALLSVQAERGATQATEEQIGGVLVPAAQSYGAQPAPIKDTPSALAAVTAQGSQLVAVATEQAFLRYVADHPGVALRGLAPATGSVLLDYPLATFTDDPAAKDAGTKLAQYLAGPVGQEALRASSFRDTQGTELGRGLGVGTVGLLAVPHDPSAVESTLHTWGVLTVPSRILAVFDVSGSMDTEVGASTRIGLTVAAATRGLAMFSSSAQIGAWAFSDPTLTSGGAPYRSLLELRGLEEPVGAQTQRDKLRTTLGGLGQITTGGTALNDTLLAAYRHMQKTYDPESVNSVLLLTDGAEDGSSELSEAEVIATLKREFDPERPVRVIFIGISGDADVGALKRMSEAVQGRYYVAENPADIGDVFVSSFLRRAEG